MTSYERVLRVVILVDGLLGLALLICPSFLVSGLSIALLPPAVIVLANRYLAVFAAVAQVLIGLFFAFSGARLAWLLAIYFFVSAYVLLTALWRGFLQYLMSKP